MVTICSKHSSLGHIRQTLLKSMRSTTNKMIQWTKVHRIIKTQADSKFVPAPRQTWNFPSDRPLCKPRIYFLPVFMNKISPSFQIYGTCPFLGAACNTGTHRTVVSLHHAHSHCNFYNVPFELIPSSVVFDFGDTSFHSIGSISFVLPIRPGPKRIPANVFPLCIPLLLSFYTLDRHSGDILTVQNTLHIVRDGWRLPRYRIQGHNYLRFLFYMRHSFLLLWAQTNALPYYASYRCKALSAPSSCLPNKLEGNTVQDFSEIFKSCNIFQQH